MSLRTENKEEFANALTHGFGVVLFIIGSFALLYKGYSHGDRWEILSAYIYGGSLILLYAASTAYHATSRPRLKSLLHLLDHSAIFILIAGTYTPFLLVGLREHIHVSYIITIWGIAVVGILYKLVMIKKYKLISTLIYLSMGWMSIFKINSFYTYLPKQAFTGIIIGGIFYSIGTIFYSKESIRNHHAIWHIFVLLGSISHFIAIYFFIY